MPSDLPTVLAFAYGYTYALVIGSIFVKNIVNSMHEDLDAQRGRIPQHSQVLGSIECFLFISAIQIEKPEFIPIWLTLKTAAGWSHWNQLSFEQPNPDGTKTPIRGRQSFNIFLAGNGLTISFSLIGSQLITWLLGLDDLPAIATAFGAVVAASCLYWALRPPRLWRWLSKRRLRAS